MIKIVTALVNSVIGGSLGGATAWVIIQFISYDFRKMEKYYISEEGRRHADLIVKLSSFYGAVAGALMIVSPDLFGKAKLFLFGL
jgi:hypothetical protein